MLAQCKRTKGAKQFSNCNGASHSHRYESGREPTGLVSVNPFPALQGSQLKAGYCCWRPASWLGCGRFWQLSAISIYAARSPRI